MASNARVVVIGGGVSGLTSAVRLLEAGFRCRVWTRDPLERTTSNVAGAIWYPYRAGPETRVAPWALASYAVFRELARDPATGVALCSGLELFTGAPEPPAWRTRVAGFRRARPDELPAGYASGYATDVPVIEMPIYLPWLGARLRALGGTIAVRTATSLDEASAEADAVVNCTGLGARELAGDPSLFAIRGQLVRVERRTVDTYVFDEHDPSAVTYVVPRSEDCILGGTAEEGVESLTPDPATELAILARCTALDPRLAGARVLGRAVGLRPGRASVRLELERRLGKPLVHDYGHGGAGVTLSWGCAEEVVRLVGAALGQP
jgi:D-amino-acid oxidase